MPRRLLVAVVLLLALLAGAYGLGLRVPRPKATGSANHEPLPGISVYFSSPGRQPESPNRIDEAFVRFVSGAARSLDIAIYLIDDPEIVEALRSAQRRGVVVRMVTDSNTLDRPKSDRLGASIATLREAGIPIVGDEHQGIMHNKFAVRDASEVWTGSWNMTDNDSTRMNNAALWLRSAELAANFTDEFEQMFTARRFSLSKTHVVRYPRVGIDGAQIETYFQPRDPGLSELIERVDEAQRSVHFLAFSFTHEGLGTAVRSRASEGLDVHGVMERSGSASVYSQLKPLREARIDVRTDANPSLMHHKTFILDQRLVATGSMNYSLNVTRSNDENVLFIDDARLARVFEAEFEAISEEARAGRLRAPLRSSLGDNNAEESLLDP